MATNSTLLGAVSVGDVGNYRQIVNVAAGTEDSDAVNVAQLNGAVQAAIGNPVHYYSVNDDGVQQANFDNTGATGGNAIAVGTGASAADARAIAVGQNASASAVDAIAMGGGAVSSGQGSTAIGANSSASASLAYAIGNGAIASSGNAYAIGNDATASGQQSIAVGGLSIASGFNSAAFGTFAEGTATNSTALGVSARASGHSAVAAGAYANASGELAVAVGMASAVGESSVAIGAFANAAQLGDVAIGLDATATGVAGTGSAVSIGNGNVATGAGAVAIGDPNTSTGSGAVTTGLDNTATGNGATAIGNTNMVGGGGQAVSTPGTAAQGAVGIGYQNTVVGQGAVGIGDRNTVTGSGAVALGRQNTATGVGSVAIGQTASATGTSSVAVGTLASASSVNAAAFGQGATASVSDSLALGSNASASVNAGDVALGSGSTTATVVGTPSAVIAGTTYNFAGTTPASTVSVGSPGFERTITNVAAGQISGTSTDAINGSQLFATNTAIDAVNATANLGWNTTTAATGTGTVSGTSVATVAPGATVTTTAGNNIAITQSGTDLTVATSMTPTFTSVTTTDLTATGTTTIGGSLTVNPGTTVNMGGNTITNVAAGVNPTDAANVSQLTTLANTPMTFTGNTGTVDRKLGETLAITGLGTTAGTYSGANLKSAVVGNEVQLQMTDTPVFTSVTTGNSLLDTNGLTITGGPSVTTTGINAGGLPITSVAPGVAGTDAVNVNQLTTVSNVANLGWNVTTAATGTGTVSGTTVQNIAPGATATYTAGDNIALTQNGAEVQIATSDTPTFTSVTTTNLTATGPTVLSGGTTISNSLTVSPGTTVNMGGNTITNVAAGVNPTDVANVSQITTLANTPMTFTGNTGTVDRKLGETLAITGLGTTAGTYSGANLKSAVVGNEVQLQMTDAPVFTSVTTTNLTATGPTVLSGGTTIGGSLTLNPATTVDMGGNVITNVAPGAAGTDAVNLNQLNAVNATANLGWNVTTAATGTGTATGTTVQNIAPGGTATYTAGNNIAITQNGAEVQIATSATPTFTSVTTTNLTATGPTTLTGGTTIGGSLTVNPGTTVNMGGNTITNVAAGVNPTDVANVSQITTLANTPMTFTGNTGTVDRLLGETLAVTGLGTTAGTYSGANLKSAVVGNEVQLQMTDTPVFTSVTTGNSLLDTNGLTITGGPSVTTAGINANNTVITNVAPGVAGTDGVNVNQLNAVNTTANLGWNVTTAATGTGTVSGTTVQNIAPGGTATYTAGNNVAITQNGAEVQIATSDTPTFTSVTTTNLTATGPTTLTGGTTIGGSLTVNPGTTVNMGGNTITNVAAGVNPTDVANVSQITTLANTPMTFTGNTGTVDRKLGETLAITGLGTTAGTYSGANLKSAVVGNEVQLQMTDTPVFTSVTTGNSLLDTNGLTITGGPSVTTAGLNANNTVITSVAPGVAGTDAVNVNQLTTVSNVANMGWNTTTAATGTGTVSGTSVANVAPGATVTTTAGDNIAITQNGTNLTIATNPDLVATSVTTGNSVLNTNGLTITGGPSVTTAGIDAAGTTISNVAPGALGTDAVNLNQLNAVSTVANAGWNLQADGDTATNVAPGGTVEFVSGQNIALVHSGNTITVATTPDLVADSLTISGGPTINSTGITMNAGNTLNMGGNTITNVGAGVNLTDAVNLSQLNTATSTAANMWITGAPATYVAPVASATNATAVGSGSTASGINSVAVGTGATATTANSVALGNDSTTGTATAVTGTTIGGTSYTFAGAAPTGVVSVGSAGAERQITNVAAGQLNATSTDAVNGSQLYATNTAISNLGTTVNAARTHYYSVNDGGVQQANYNNDGATGTNSLASGVGASASGPGGVAVGLNSVATGGNSVAIGAASVVSSVGGVALGAGSTADRPGMSGRREAFSNVSVSSTQGAVSVGSSGNERQITNVAGGIEATDAVNVRQLQAVKDGGINYSTNADGTTNYNQVILGNGQAPNGTVISNVAPGVVGTDAVNVNQLSGAIGGVNNRINALGDQVNKIGRNAYAGVAAAMAVQMPGQSLPGKTVMRVGYGVFKGESAVGISFRRTSDNNAWSLTGGVGMSRAGAAATVGAEWVFD
ncbi:hypothetical protein [Variovorax sp. AFSI2.2]|uniref:hypothetical protein n=1 Tax=Variovorax sp. AFSI2.2 TaxID=3384160 RepID=UPI003EBC34AA